ncbi:MAG: hypothetical protein QME60_02000 [Verrucomicrobiota bacterium]|nr:hypothetical protein [Verrucomicrobiota bacterium]
MRSSRKPVRRCHACLLNLGDRCWLFPHPRGQWQRGRWCRGFGNEERYREFRDWQKEPTVKSRKELRRDFFRAGKKTRRRWKRPVRGR